MIGGWLLAEALVPGFDPVVRTISELATADVPHPGVMTAGLLVTGLAHVATAAGLRGVPLTGRLVLALGGAATAAVGLLPLDRDPHAHGVAAAVAFGALALWPAASARRSGAGPLRPVVACPRRPCCSGCWAGSSPSRPGAGPSRAWPSAPWRARSRWRPWRWCSRCGCRAAAPGRR